MSNMIVSIKDVVPDEKQPRKYFDASKMHSLKESIKEHGIINPIIVEKMPNEKYLVVDGERRYRAAQELNLKEIPVLVTKSSSDTERLIRQFNIQEQHAEWTPIEKAVALTKLAASMHTTMHQICDILNMSKHDREIYASFAELADKEGFARSEISLEYAKPFRSIRNFTKHIVEMELDDKFDLSDEKQLEGSLVRSIKNGSITEKKDITKLRDAFKKSPKLIRKFLDNKDSTPQDLFIEAKAKGTYYLRGLLMCSRQMTNQGRRWLESKDYKVSRDELTYLVTALDVLKKVVNATD